MGERINNKENYIECCKCIWFGKCCNKKNTSETIKESCDYYDPIGLSEDEDEKLTEEIIQCNREIYLKYFEEEYLAIWNDNI